MTDRAYNEHYQMVMHLHQRQQAQRAARRKRRGPKLSKTTRAKVIERDAGMCGICGQPILPDQQTTIDHILPIAAGGTNALDNLQLAHSRCNLLKGAKV